MKYIVTKHFKNNCLSGYVNLPYGTKCYSDKDYIYTLDNECICSVSSQNAYDYFSNDEDNNGKERGNLVQTIIGTLTKRNNKYQARWNKIWADEKANKLRNHNHEDFWIWSYDFYNAPIDELKRILSLIKEV